ncbi:MAG: hypothetical protein RL095_1010 [Verrucomicrobiota bacterium]
MKIGPITPILPIGVIGVIGQVQTERKTPAVSGGGF